MAEAISPCLLWIDELEKAFSGTKGEVDGGTSKRIFGSFLTWLSEKTADVFIVATANNVSALPPEFLRSGRFDVIFFVDLPDEIQREEIIKIHLEKVSRKIKDFDMPELVKASDTFTGAEIEVWVQEALALAFSKESELKTEHMISKAQEITPIARLMEEDIKKSREWAKSHGVKPAYIPAPKLAVKVKVNGDGPRKVNLN
jgi:SpoVK/Ycf46/Vps4 family AAA+-type ATPase